LLETKTGFAFHSFQNAELPLWFDDTRWPSESGCPTAKNGSSCKQKMATKQEAMEVYIVEAA
jgi:hypothetical protein